MATQVTTVKFDCVAQTKQATAVVNCANLAEYNTLLASITASETVGGAQPIVTKTFSQQQRKATLVYAADSYLSDYAATDAMVQDYQNDPGGRPPTSNVAKNQNAQTITVTLASISVIAAAT